MEIFADTSDLKQLEELNNLGIISGCTTNPKIFYKDMSRNEENVQNMEYFKEHMKKVLKTVNGEYICATYATRLGPQKTVSGKTFNCVPIKEVLQHKGYLSECAYRDGSITGRHQIKK